MNLRKHRTEVLGDTLEGVAKRARLSAATICNIERGVRISKKHLNKLARGYRLTPDELAALVGSQLMGEVRA